jgi:hypothetical protein
MAKSLRSDVSAQSLIILDESDLWPRSRCFLSGGAFSEKGGVLTQAFFVQMRKATITFSLYRKGYTQMLFDKVNSLNNSQGRISLTTSGTPLFTIENRLLAVIRLLNRHSSFDKGVAFGTMLTKIPVPTAAPQFP